MIPSPLRNQISRNVPMIADIILTHTARWSIDQAGSIDKASPGSSFGWGKYEEMVRAAKKLPLATRCMDIPVRDQPLLKIILATHDLGRHIEFHVRQCITTAKSPEVFLRNLARVINLPGNSTLQAVDAVIAGVSFPCTLTPELNAKINLSHGTFSAAVLEDLGLLDSLPNQNDRDDILHVLKNHCLARPSDPPSERATNFLKAMQAVDCFEILLRAPRDFFTGDGMEHQHKTHFAGAVPNLKDSQRKPPLEQLVAAFEEGRLGDKKDLLGDGSMQGYVVWILCLLRNIMPPAVKTPELLQEFKRKRLDRQMLGFLKEWGCPDPLFARVEQRLDTVLAT